MVLKHEDSGIREAKYHKISKKIKTYIILSNVSTAFFHFCFRQQSFTINDSQAAVSLCSASFSVSLPKVRFTQLDVKSRKNNEII